MRRLILGLVGGSNALNGLTMLTAGQRWYALVPGVTETGPYNGHFIQDIGIAFLIAGLALAATTWRPALWPAGVAGAGFLAGHALLHLAGLAAGHAHHAAFDLAAIVVPAALAVIAAIPAKEIHHV
ncbi:hypothetical protein [Bradyrhizobium sp. 2TAF24]|uniref:hypothetical protein n=1 Tax=Bradyrhizobium sp. 2TAF24 TaxID=3233011 RepID=UPI003F92938D